MTMKMKIPIRVTKSGAANWVEHEVEMERPVELWTDSDLHQLVGRMQWCLGGQKPVATREPIDRGYRVTVAVAGMAAETVQPLPLTDASAKSAVWAKPDATREGDILSVLCPDCGGELRADKRFELWSRTLGEPEMRTPFWSTTCAACGHRFNYSPGSGEIRRFEP